MHIVIGLPEPFNSHACVHIHRDYTPTKYIYVFDTDLINTLQAGAACAIDYAGNNAMITIALAVCDEQLRRNGHQAKELQKRIAALED